MPFSNKKVPVPLPVVLLVHTGMSCHPSCSFLTLCSAGSKLSTPLSPGPAPSPPLSQQPQVPVFVQYTPHLNTSIFHTYVTQGVSDPCHDPGSRQVPCSIISCPSLTPQSHSSMEENMKTVPKQRSRCILPLCVYQLITYPRVGLNEELVTSHCLLCLKVKLICTVLPLKKEKKSINFVSNRVSH